MKESTIMEVPSGSLDNGRRIRDKNPREQAAQLFLDLGVDEKIYPGMLDRLESTGEHFGDALEMGEMVKDLWNNLGFEKANLEKVRLCTVLHDIGKSGPLEASTGAKQIVHWLFSGRNIDLEENTTIKEYTERLQQSNSREKDYPVLGGDEWQEFDALIEKEMGLSTDKCRIKDFWRRHAFWTRDILQHYQKEQPTGPVDKWMTIVAASHHLLEGRDPMNFLASTSSVVSKDDDELWRGIQVITVLDRYQARRRRGGNNHKQAVSILKKELGGLDSGGENKVTRVGEAALVGYNDILKVVDEYVKNNGDFNMFAAK